jgi:hypothetical protein
MCLDVKGKNPLHTVYYFERLSLPTSLVSANGDNTLGKLGIGNEELGIIRPCLKA